MMRATADLTSASPGTTPEPLELAWHGLDIDDVLSRLETHPDGLSTAEAGARLARVGPNELEAEAPTTVLQLLWHQFTSPLIAILGGAAVITTLLGEHIDTAVIAAVLVLNAVVGFVQEHKADRSVRSLMQLAAQRSVVVRGGVVDEVDSRELVPGDIVLLESGTRVPADLRIQRATALRIDESLLTGESLPASKGTEPVEVNAVAPDRTCMAFMGSLVTSGRGRGVVVMTGTATELGRISERIRTEAHPESPLTRRMRRFARIIAVAVGASAAAAFALGIATGESAGVMLLTAVALAVAVVPEGLPIALTVAMALGVRRMAQRQAIIRSLPAVETLGSTTVIGSDKTGTLTQNRMTVQRVWAAGREHDIDALEEAAVDGANADVAVLRTLEAGVLTNEAHVRLRSEGPPEVSGDPTEAALLIAAARCGLDPDALRRRPLVAEVPFEPELRCSYAVRTEPDGRQRLWLKGAPERVLELCTRMVGTRGHVALDADAVHAAADAHARDGLRVLAMAYRDLDEDLAPGSSPRLTDLVLAGLQGMLDPPRPGVRDAIEACTRAGIRVLMITGDHASTARAIAADLGITDGAGDAVLTGPQIEAMSEAELATAVTRVAVYARVSPEHKHRVVTALRGHGEVVAVTGDGVNDGPALRAADIGVAMGRSGTDVAREASDMVLATDDFVAIVDAVEEGRVVFDNVRKVTFFLVSTGVAAIAALLYAIAAGLPLPLLPAQLLWLNVVTNGLQDVALAFEPGERGVLDRPPRRRLEPVVSALLWERTALTGVTMAIGAMALFQWSLNSGASLAHARTVALTTLVIAMAFHVGNARSEHRSVLRLNPLRNPFLLVATSSALLLHAAALHWGPTQLVLRFTALPGSTWVRMTVVASAVLLVAEVHKRIRRPRRP